MSAAAVKMHQIVKSAAGIATREIDRKISKLQRELSQVRTGDRKSLEALVRLTAETAGEIELTVTYQIPGASWRPITSGQSGQRSLSV